MRSKSRVHLTVSSQATGILEGLAALFTNVRSLACVLPKVVLVVGAPFEGERAVGTLERPYSCVYSLMDREQRRPLETLSTLSAAIGPFASVISHVVLQP